MTAARKMKGQRKYSGKCQAFSILTSKTGSATPDFDGDGDHDAVDWWKHAVQHGKVVHAKDIRSYADIPAGTLAYWTGGSNGYGHAAPTTPGGNIVSTDAPKWGTIGEVPIGWIATNWRNGLKFVGYIVNDGYEHQMVDEPAAPKPPAPKPDLVRHFGHRHLNTWGDDGGKGTASLTKRVDQMTADLVSGTKPEVITLNEVQDDDVPSWRKRLVPHGFDVVLAEAGNLVAVPAGTEVRKAQSKYLPAAIQGGGRREALGMVRAKINGHWEHILVSHLDYRDGAKYDAIRVKQADWIADQAKRWADTFDLDNWRTHTTVGIDENSHTWVRDKGFVPAGFDVAYKSGIDAIYGNRATLTGRKIKTASDHPIIDVVYAKTATK